MDKKCILVTYWCYTCKGSEQSVDHLLLHWPIASELWCMVFKLLGASWVIPKSVVDLIASYKGYFHRHQDIVIWKAIPHCLKWWIRQEQNAQCFEDSERYLPDIKLFFFKMLFEWMLVVGSPSLCSLSNFVDICNLWDWLYISCILGYLLSINKIYLSKKHKRG